MPKLVYISFLAVAAAASNPGQAAPATEPPPDVVILVDASSSMNDHGRMAALKTAVRLAATWNQSRAPLFVRRRISSFSDRVPIFLNPLQKRSGRDDARELMQGFPQLGAKPERPLPLLGRDRDPGRQLAPQKLVLNLHIADLPSQFVLPLTGDDQQQRAKQ